MAFRTQDHTDMKLFKNRLWRLMEEQNILTTKKLAKKLYDGDYVSVKQKESFADPSAVYGNAIGAVDKKIQDHLKLDNTDKLQGEFAKAYCDFFKCSADYLFGYIEYPTHTTTDICKETGLSESAIKYLQEKSRSKHYTDILNILLRPGNFDNALYHISEYIEAASLYNGLRKIKDDKKQKIIDECLEKDGDLRSYNCPQDNSLDTMIKESEIKKDVEELRIDQNFKYIIQEIADIARKRNLNTFKMPNSTTK